MTPKYNVEPSKPEARDQLRRMLESPTFISRPQQATVFAFIVENSIDKHDITAKDIFVKCFPINTQRYSDGTTIVPTTIYNLRTLIGDYYEGEGEYDPVVISLPDTPRALLPKGLRVKAKRTKSPAGKAYRTVFSYNLKHHDNRLYFKAKALMDRVTPRDNMMAAGYFGSCSPAHFGAKLAEATACFRSTLFDRYSGPGHNREAETCVRQALALDPNSWEAHALLGAIKCCQWEWQDAANEFAAALEFDSSRTSYESWYYPAYLLTIGKIEDAITMAAIRSINNPADPFAIAIHVIFLFIARRFQEVTVRISYARSILDDHWLIDTLSALLHIEYCPVDEHNLSCPAAVSYLEQARKHKMSYGLAAGLDLIATRNARDTFDKPYHFEMTRTKPFEFQLQDALHTFDGHLEGLKSWDYFPALNYSLRALAVNDQETAVDALLAAHREGDPLLGWLHLWPFFRPLCSNARFLDLYELMAVPWSSSASPFSG